MRMYKPPTLKRVLYVAVCPEEGNIQCITRCCGFDLMFIP